ncbi:MAG: pyridoxal phosphate-dependent aminotransferase [Lachnospiraceae bacterium]|nr:pyridoxal phosphate-dependent aminotransferase [Lachnospiraceae bacterium]
MICKKMEGLVKGSSAIRAMFEEGQKMAAVYGAANVYDFSLGNPNVAPPEAVKEAVMDLIQHEDPMRLHGYMSNTGFESTRTAVADSLNRKYGTHYTAGNIIMTVGAASGLNVVFRSLLNPGDEVITFAPFFAEYRNYVANYDGVLVEISPDTETFQPKLDEFEKRITAKTKCVLVNSPNNPTGVIYSADTYRRMAKILEEKQKEYGTDIYLITDEPYRELVYGDVEVPFVPDFYTNTIVGYSFSKSLSLPGERIGYLVIPSEVADFDAVYAAAGVANRILGYVNAPSMFQLVVERCLEETTDIAYYERNRNTLYEGLTKLGFSCIKPDGAFYLFMKSPIADEKAFCEIAKKYHILIVPGSGFGCPGFVRIAYCVSFDTIMNSLPAFAELAKETLS